MKGNFSLCITPIGIARTTARGRCRCSREMEDTLWQLLLLLANDKLVLREGKERKGDDDDRVGSRHLCRDEQEQVPRHDKVY